MQQTGVKSKKVGDQKAEEDMKTEKSPAFQIPLSRDPASGGIKERDKSQGGATIPARSYSFDNGIESSSNLR